MKRPIQCLVVLLLLVASKGFANGEPILFDFESPPDSDSGNGMNPTFTRGGITLTFSSDLPAAAQWTNDSRSLPFSGTGSMRLTQRASGGGLSEAIADFSTPLSSLELYAQQWSGAPDPFTIEAYDATDALLDSFTTSSVGNFELVQFSGIDSIARVRFKGEVNCSYFDDLTAVPIPEPSAVVLLVIGTISLVGYGSRPWKKVKRKGVRTH